MRCQSHLTTQISRRIALARAVVSGVGCLNDMALAEVALPACFEIQFPGVPMPGPFNNERDQLDVQKISPAGAMSG